MDEKTRKEKVTKLTDLTYSISEEIFEETLKNLSEEDLKIEIREWLITFLLKFSLIYKE